jgi:N-acetylglutamate synthase-like GNAT family acetyltransferase
MSMEWTEGNYRISNDKSLLDIERICKLLAKSYWANERSREKIELSIKNSLCYGIYCEQKQIGFARVVTDSATMYWLCDVFIDEEFRGKSLGKRLIQCIVESPELTGLIGILATNDAHGLYEQYGFKKIPDRYMRRSPAQK